MFAHYTAHARPGRHPFADERLARWTWERLRSHFPDALAADLMPDHLHMIAPDGGPEAVQRLSRLLGGCARTFGCGELWAPVPAPVPLVSPDKLRRSVRYTWLNPCRPWRYAGGEVQLVPDPLMWAWSTLRDAVGTTVDPWTPADRVARAFGWHGDDLARGLHRYASADDHVAGGVRFPCAAAPSRLPDGAFADLVAAVLAATRAPRDSLRQRTFARRVLVGLAYRQGWSHPSRLAALCNAHPDSISRIAAKAPAGAVEAAALCLGDVRLRTPPVSLQLLASGSRAFMSARTSEVLTLEASQRSERVGTSGLLAFGR